MKNTERIRNYIQEKKERGSLNPGDKLPSYKKLMKHFDLSYVTVASAVGELAREGILETRKGSGSYLAGNSPLKVLIHIHPTSIPCYKMRELLNKYLANSALHIDFEVRAVEELGDPEKLKECMNECKAAISSYSAFTKEESLPSVQLSTFSDYGNVISELKTAPGVNYETSLPFSYTMYQTAVNTELLERTGFTPDMLQPGFDWWENFANKCKKQEIAPASIDFHENQNSIFTDMLPVMMMLFPYDKHDYTGTQPLFETHEADPYFRIAEDTALISEQLHDPRSFYRNGAVLNFRAGSWLTVQNANPERMDKKISHLAFLPYRTIEGDTFHLMTEEALKMYLHQDVSPDERSRVWRLMKIMTSREFQTEYCSITGNIAANRDVLPTEHFWNRHGEFNGFFPKKGEKTYFIKRFYLESQIAALSLLLEDMICYKHNSAEIRKRMDIKKRFFQVTQDYKTILSLEDSFWNKQKTDKTVRKGAI